MIIQRIRRACVSVLGQNIPNWAALIFIAFLVPAIGIALLSTAWNILLHPTAILGSWISSESQATLVALLLVILGVPLFFVDFEIAKGLFKYAKKWSKRP
jgi:hypothetical protein